MHTGYLGPAALFCGTGALGFWLAQRRVRRVNYLRQEELDVSQLKAGACKVMGVVQQPAEPLVAPLSGNPCAYYVVLVQELRGHGRNRRWYTVFTERRFAPFKLKDRKGPATVDVLLAGAEMKLDAEGGSGDFAQLDKFLASRGQSAFLGRGELRANETTLTAGERVFVLGDCVEAQPGVFTLKQGAAPFIVSDKDAGEIGYNENNAMYLTRFWAGAATLVGLYFLRHVF